MPFGRLNDRFRSFTLTAKLTIWNTLVVLLISIVAVFSVREGLRWMLLKELETVLEAEAYEIALSAARFPESSPELFLDMQNTSAGHIRRGWFLQLFDRSERVNLWSSDHTPVVFSQSPYFLHQKTVVVGEERFRFAESAVERNSREVYLVRVGTSLNFIEEDLGNVTSIATPVLVGVFLLAPIGGYVLARRATRPLQRLIAASRLLHPTRLEERLPLRNSGDELDQLSEDINHFLDQIAEFIQLNREFIANAAHEIRSPLTALLTSMEVTLSRPRTVAEYQELLLSSQEQCRDLATLANQLLLLAESDAGLLRAHFTKVSLDQVVRSAVDMFQGVAEDRGINLNAFIDSNILIAGDTSRIRQVVNNLIDNAIKFTPTGGRIEVRLGKNIDLTRVCFSVSDSGIGIDQDMLGHVFDRFFQAETSRYRNQAEQAGFGLGLSICRSIVQAFDGRITVTSQLGTGSTFRVEFPAIIDGT